MKDTITIKVKGASDNPHALDSNQILVVNHHLGSSLSLCWPHSQEHGPEVLKDRDLSETQFDGLMLIHKHDIAPGADVPITLLIGGLLSASKVGKGLAIEETRGNQILLDRLTVLRASGYVKFGFEVREGDMVLHVFQPEPDNYNPNLVKSVSRQLDRALLRSSLKGESSPKVRWGKLDKKWRRLLSRGRFRLLSGNGSLGFYFRHDNAVNRADMGVGFEPDRDQVLRVDLLEDLIVNHTLRLRGWTDPAHLLEIARRLKLFVSKNYRGESILDLACADQGEYEPREGYRYPHLTQYLFELFAGEKKSKGGK